MSQHLADPLPLPTGAAAVHLNPNNHVIQETSSAIVFRSPPVLPPVAAAKATNKASRRWIFTSYLDTEPVWNPEKLQYLIYQREQCPTTNRKHWQGYCIVRKPTKIPGLQSVLGIGKSWCRIPDGNHEQCVIYCSKPETRLSDPVIQGTGPVGRGHRTDLDDYREAVINGADERTLFEDHISVHAKYTGLKRRIQEAYDLVPKRDGSTMPEVQVYWGPTGTGKTRKAWEENPGAYMLRDYGNISGATLWTGYAGESTVIIDEFYGWAKWHELLGWLDRYPCQVRVHMGMVSLTATKFIITSNTHPEQWYHKIIEEGKVKYETLRRRITNITHFDSQFNQ